MLDKHVADADCGSRVNTVTAGMQHEQHSTARAALQQQAAAHDLLGCSLHRPAWRQPGCCVDHYPVAAPDCPIGRPAPPVATCACSESALRRATR
jgi:hypothetical protein